MAIIKAPFNFVPLADKVYIPDWADKISQDIPFSDGVSGYIDLKITAKSPIYIRNGHTKEEAEQGKETVKKAIEEAKKSGKDDPDFSLAKQLPYNSFSKSPDGRFFIPATSIKGEVRSLLEILTFSKMRVDRSIKYAQREWYDEYLYPKQEIQKDIMCGYLRWDKEKKIYVITSHGKPYRIGYDKIDEYLEEIKNKHNLFKRYFSDQRGTDQSEVIVNNGKSYDINEWVCLNGEEFDPKTASFKYKLVGDVQLQNLSFDKDETSTDYSTRLKYNPQGEIKGDIVFTGQPGYCKWERQTKSDSKAGKFYDFVFPCKTEGNPIEMNEIEFNYFKFIYCESSEWRRVEDLLDGDNSKGVPVFFRIKKCKFKEADKETGKEKEVEQEQIMDFGLAYLYKLPYVNSPADILDKKYGKDKDSVDLAECLFGYVDTNIKERNIKKDNIKGRVQFSNFYSTNAERDKPVTLVLNSPKASYYPIYIKQPRQNGGVISLNTNYQSYNDGQLSGWKKYVVRDQTWENKTEGETDSTLFPLKEGAVFNGEIRFHNLRPMELGALLSALTFHSTDRCYHLLGQGKPYGYGKTLFTVNLHCNERNDNKEYFMALFEKYMLDKFPSWRYSDTIKSLIALAKTEVKSLDYEYMKLTVKPNRNEFAIAKRQDKETKKDEKDYHPLKEYLQDFISLQGGQSLYFNPNPINIYLGEIKERTADLLVKIGQVFAKAMTKFETKLNENDYNEAEQILRTVKMSLYSPPEPVLLSEVSSYIETLNEKETILEKKLREKELQKHQAIYQEALSANSIDALKIIEDAIGILEAIPFDEKSKWIEELQRKKEIIKRGTLDISSFLAGIKVTSINAFANSLNKRHAITPISIDDIPFITQKLKEEWANLKVSDRKVWLDRKKWGQMEKGLGAELTNSIFDGIKDQPIK